jgi:rubrerythrin
MWIVPGGDAMKPDLVLRMEDVLRVAERLEAACAEFYRLAAKSTQDSDLKRMLLEFAVEEIHHKDHFNSLRNMLLENDPLIDPGTGKGDKITAEYLESWLNEEPFRLHERTMRSALLKSKPANLIRLAIELENESIAFFSRIAGLLPEEPDRKVVLEIIRCEMSHLVQLNKLLPTQSVQK